MAARSIYLEGDLEAALEGMADRLGVKISPLVAACIRRGLDALEAGETLDHERVVVRHDQYRLGPAEARREEFEDGGPGGPPEAGER